RKAFLYINKGLNADENGFKEDARNFYRQGQEHLLRGLGVSLRSPEYVGPGWDSARQMQVKMQETLENVNTRLNILQQSMAGRVPGPSSASADTLYPSLPAVGKEKPERPPLPRMPLFSAEPINRIPCIPTKNLKPLNPLAVGAAAPPAYTPQATDGHFTVSYGTESGEQSIVGDDFYSMTAQPPPVQSLGVDAVELILIPRGVQIFFVTPEGEVSAPSYPGYLRIIKFMDTTSEMAQNRPPAFLQVCDWLYPLMCTQSPVLRSNTGVYMFPDLMSQAPGSYVGVVLSAELPAASRELFEDLLRQMSDLRIQPSEALGEVIDLSQTVHVTIPESESEPRKRIDLPLPSEKVAQGILQGTSWLNCGLVKGDELTGKAITKGATKLREHIQPLEVNPTVAKGLHVAKQATGGAVKVSHFLVNGACSFASCFGREFGPRVSKHISKLIPESRKRDTDGKSPLDGAMVVAVGGLQGLANAWLGMECAGKNIARSVARETVHTIKNKYGKNAGHPAYDALNCAVNIGVTAFNIQHLSTKAIVRKTARAILDEYQLSNKKGEPH
ncbi:spartin-like, partial [Pyxicephalus adspersus]|uniref:spartin-like n=1 Tax=Pyxicephalus adspersus TaxID=30357 RepID=UPI003B5CB3C0